MIQGEIRLANEALNALAAHIAVLDTRGVIVFVNDAWNRFAKDNGGVPGADAFVGTDYLAVCRDAVRRGDDRARQALSGIEEVRRGEREEFSLDYPCHGPEQERWFRLSVTAFTVGVEPCVVVAHHDITDRHRVEAEREAMLHEHDRLRLSAQQANRLKDDFIATLSHELRTPLQSVLGWTTILKRSPEQREVVDRAAGAIERNTRLLARLVDETLDLTRIARGMLELDESNVDFVALVAEAFDIIRPAASEKGVALSQQLSGTHATVRGDATRLQQIVWNLLTNAVKFTPAGGRIEARAHRAGEWVELSVRDTGIGIAAEFLPFVFERFRQGTGPQLGTQPGLGLGLSIAKELVERHHGTITAQSAGEGQGATFTVRLPLAAGG